MKKSSTNVATAQGAVTTQSQDLFAMFQAFIAQQQVQPVTVTAPIVATMGESVKSNANVPAKTERKPAKRNAKTVATVAPVQIHKAANSFFVSGEGATAKLAEFFAKKPHLNRGFVERKALGGIKAYWFGGRQLPKIERELAK
jgi:hypothetical protein